MKSLIFIITLFCIQANAYERALEVLFGGYTYHLTDGGASGMYSNKVSSDGRLIRTPELGLRVTHEPGNYSYQSTAIFMGTNSVGSPIYGGMLSTGASLRLFNLGFVFGGYIQNNEDFRARGIQPYSMTGNTNAFVPLVGVELNFKIEVTDRTFIGINNIMTPIITNHNLSFGYRY